MRRRSRPAFFNPASGFTLLEVVVAMALVMVLVGGIALTVSTSLRVWERTRETAELNQEARAIMDLLARDLRGAYLGLYRKSGYFLAGEQHRGTALEFTTEQAGLARVALSPEAAAQPVGLSTEPPASDFIAVRYEFDAPSGNTPGTLVRRTWVAPVGTWLAEPPAASAAIAEEHITDSLLALTFRYYDGNKWQEAWETSEDNLQLPKAVAIELTLQDGRKHEHTYQSIVFPAAQ